jgi:hypothetical protein
MADYIGTLGTLKCIKNIYDNQYESCMKTLKDELENNKMKIIENILKQIAVDYNISEKDLFKRYLKKTKLKKKNKDFTTGTFGEDTEETIIQNIIKNDNNDVTSTFNELIEKDKIEKQDNQEKKIIYKKLKDIEKFPELQGDDYFVNLTTNEIIKGSTKEIIGKLEDKKLLIQQSFINRNQNNIN